MDRRPHKVKGASPRLSVTRGRRKARSESSISHEVLKEKSFSRRNTMESVKDASGDLGPTDRPRSKEMEDASSDSGLTDRPPSEEMQMEDASAGDLSPINGPPSEEMQIASGEESSDEGTIVDNEYVQYLLLYRAVDSGNWEATKKFLDDHPNALSASISSYGETALHIAAMAGHVKIVEELVKLMSPQDLALRTKLGVTALSFAAEGQITKIAELMVNKNLNLLSIPNMYGDIPVVVASTFGCKDMVQYLYDMTPAKELSPEQASKSGATLLTNCILAEFYDIALHLLKRYPGLAIVLDDRGDSALNALAKKTSAFPSGSGLLFWQRWIYSCVRVQPTCTSSNVVNDIESPHEIPIDREKMITQAPNQLLGLVWNLLKPFVPGIKHIYDRKLKHVQALELLRSICQEIWTLEESQLRKIGVYGTVFNAVNHGIVEFIAEIVESHPNIVWSIDNCKRNIFLIATMQRQEKIFSLLYRMGAKKNSLAAFCDKFGNNMLHQAAILAPSSELDRVSGAALQMQRELQWFKEVENIVQPRYVEMVNKKGLTPRALFTKQHKMLKDEGEKWMKDTATSCTVVAALIATIMFAVAFTVPGGYNGGTGIPIFLNHSSFMVFIISDALSLFSSATSLLMFMGIMTSRYREEDFLKSLPTKLIIGLSALFFSIATMMTTFGITLVIMLRERLTWISIPIILLAGIPVTLFALLQFPLLVEIFISTYGPRIFDKPKRSGTM